MSKKSKRFEIALTAKIKGIPKTDGIIVQRYITPQNI
jgi:hypothetical protein